MKTIKILFFSLWAIYVAKAQNQLLIPPVLSGESIDLELRKGTHQFYEGTNTKTFGINGEILGPTLVLEKGQMVNIHVINNIGETTTMHWHGMHVSAVNDGGPHTTIAPDEVWNPQFQVLDHAATYWYHPHLHEHTNDHVLMGLAGLIIVKDQQEASLELPRAYGVDDIPLVIQTKTFDDNKQIVTGLSAEDTVVLANATRNAYVDVPAQVIRLRMLNGASQRIFELGFSNNMEFYQIASDGGLLSRPVPMKRLRLSPGERAEILIDLSGMQNQEIKLMSFASELPRGYYGAAQVGVNPMMAIKDYDLNPLNGSNFDILTLKIGMPVGGVTTIPESLVEVNPYLESEADVTRFLSFRPKIFGPQYITNGPFIIDDESFDIDVINKTIKLGDIEVWAFVNQTMVAHPFHIHDVQFYAITRDGYPVPENERGRKDVILVPPMGGTVSFITKFEDFADDEVPYMYHCHMLTHEDEGMMGQFIVVNPSATDGDNLLEPISIYPNPAVNFINIDGGKIDKIELIDVLGRGQTKIFPVRKVTTIDLSKYASGMYHLNVWQDGIHRAYKIIKI